MPIIDDAPPASPDLNANEEGPLEHGTDQSSTRSNAGTSTRLICASGGEKTGDISVHSEVRSQSESVSEYGSEQGSQVSGPKVIPLEYSGNQNYYAKDKEESQQRDDKGDGDENESDDEVIDDSDMDPEWQHDTEEQTSSGSESESNKLSQVINDSCPESPDEDGEANGKIATIEDIQSPDESPDLGNSDDIHKEYQEDIYQYAVVNDVYSPQESDEVSACFKCGELFTNLDTLADHVDMYHMEEEITSGSDGSHALDRNQHQEMSYNIVSIEGMARPSSSTNDEADPVLITCQYCLETFTMPIYLANHISTNHSHRFNKCPTCDLIFQTKLTLTEHVKYHQYKEMFICHCGKIFKKQISLARHQIKCSSLQQDSVDL